MNILSYSIALCVWLFSIPVLAEPAPLPLIDAFKVITIEGVDVRPLLGRPINQLSVVAIFDGNLEPIPYQIDQYNIGGAVYFEGWDVPMAGDPELMDATDKLLFLYKDAGARRTGDELYDGDIVAEVVLRDTVGTERYVYLVQHSRLRSDEQYVRYSSEMGYVETDFYALHYNPENHLQWLDFSYNGYLGERPIDALKLILKGGILTSFTELELNSNQMIAMPTGEIIGPIRTTTQLEFNVVILSVPLLKLSVQIHHFPTAIMYDVRGVIPQFRRSMVVNPRLSMSVDANQLQGATIQSSANPLLTGVVDGEIDKSENALAGAPLNPMDNWIWVSSKRNLDWLSFVDYLGDFDSNLSLILEDDAKNTEALDTGPRQMFNTGYNIEQFPEKGFVGVLVSLFVSQGFEGEPARFAHRIRSLPEMEIHLFQSRRTAATITSL